MSDVENKDNHLDEITLMLYAERQLDREAAQEVSLHTQTCTRCLNLLRALDRESRLLTRSMLEQDEPLPERLTNLQAKVRRSMQWLWGVVFGLVVLGVYAFYDVYVEPLQSQLDKAGFGSGNLVSLLVFQGAFWKGWQSMFTLVEFVALASLAGFALFLVRKYLRRGAALAFVLASVGLLLVTANPAPAQDWKFDVENKRHHESYELKKDEVRRNDLFFTGQHLRVSGTVDGDVYAFAQQVDIDGHVTGDVICFAQTARVPGQVDGNVRSFTNNITISGNVAKNVTAMNEVLNLDSKATIGQSLSVFTQNATVDGKIARDFRGFFQEATVTGSIGGNLKTKGDALTIGSGAEIKGKATFEGNKPADVASDAKLASPLEFKQMEHRSHMDHSGGSYVWRVIWAAAYVLFGLVLLSLLPLFSREATTNVEQSVGASFGLGVLVVISMFFASLLACVTIVGLFVGLSALSLWIGCLFFAQIIVGSFIGEKILGRPVDFWGMVGRMALGVVILRAAIAIPFLGFWIKWGAIFWGFGAISLAVYRRLQPHTGPNVPSSPAPVAPLGGAPLPPNTTVGGV